jgi:hypothetical protein
VFKPRSGETAGVDKTNRSALSNRCPVQQRYGHGNKEKNRPNRGVLGSVKEVAAQGRKYDEKETSPQRRAANWFSYVWSSHILLS